MATLITEFEMTSSLPADAVFKFFVNADKIAPKADPQTYKSIDTIEGDGGVGTIRKITFSDAIPYKSAKLKFDAIDTNNFTYTFTIFEGDVLLDILDSITNHITIVPSVDGGSLYKHKIIHYLKGDTKPSEEILNMAKEAHKKTFKALEAYAIANP